MITVTEVHAPSDESDDAKDLKYAFASCYLKGKPIELDLKLRTEITSLLMKNWHEAHKEDKRPDREPTGIDPDGPVGQEHPSILVILQSEDKTIYLLRLTDFSARLEKLNRPLENIDLYFTDHKTTGTSFVLPQKYHDMLAPK